MSATPFTSFTKLGSSVLAGPTGIVGWKVGPTGNVYDDSFDLIATEFVSITGVTGYIGSSYSLINKFNSLILSNFIFLSLLIIISIYKKPL